ncbi:MAG: PTS sugar transporter subunit IIA [Phycisphaerae bacterium]|nr:PTS sugar transporter subunit IIA [Phycisphaerae bacterium]
MKLTDIVAPECIRVPLHSSTKEDVITELVDLLAEHERISDREEVLKSVMDREATRSTGIGHGLAVPHCKTAACVKLVAAIGKPAKPLDFESKDGQSVDLVVLLISPLDQTGPHIQALARISRLMLTEHCRNDLACAQSGADVIRVITQFES